MADDVHDDASQIVFTSRSNGITPEMADPDLLVELSTDTIGPSYGYVVCKVTQGEDIRRVKLKIRPVDLPKLFDVLGKLSAEDKHTVLTATQHAHSIAFDDETWLQALGAFVWGLAPPHYLRLDGTVVWQADGEPQDLCKAMQAVVQAGFDYLHVNDVSNAVTRLTRDVRQGELGNS